MRDKLTLTILSLSNTRYLKTRVPGSLNESFPQLAADYNLICSRKRPVQTPAAPAGAALQT
ncbi:MAG: hypothetical protein ABSG46_04545, partial [Candidatus Binataceae bacterium]